MSTTKNTHVALSDLYDFQAGYNVRGKLELDEGGEQVVQLKDVGGSGFDVASLSRADLGKVSDRYSVQSGDIVFRTRLEPNVACRLNGLEHRATVLAPLAILRPKTDTIDPDYLVWFVGQSPAQRFLDGIRQGTKLPQIPIDKLKELPVAVPPLDVQRKLVAVSELADREQELCLKIAEKRRKIMSFVLLQQVRKTQPHDRGLGSKSSKDVGASKDITPNGH